MTIWAVRLWGRNISGPCYAIYRELLWTAAGFSDADSNLISWRVKRCFVPQDAPRHPGQFIRQSDRQLVAMHAL